MNNGGEGAHSAGMPRDGAVGGCRAAAENAALQSGDAALGVVSSPGQHLWSSSGTWSAAGVPDQLPLVGHPTSVQVEGSSSPRHGVSLSGGIADMPGFPGQGAQGCHAAHDSTHSAGSNSVLPALTIPTSPSHRFDGLQSSVFFRDPGGHSSSRHFGAACSSAGPTPMGADASVATLCTRSRPASPTPRDSRPQPEAQADNGTGGYTEEAWDDSEAQEGGAAQRAHTTEPLSPSPRHRLHTRSHAASPASDGDAAGEQGEAGSTRMPDLCVRTAAPSAAAALPGGDGAGSPMLRPGWPDLIGADAAGAMRARVRAIVAEALERLTAVPVLPAAALAAQLATLPAAEAPPPVGDPARSELLFSPRAAMPWPAPADISSPITRIADATSLATSDGRTREEESSERPAGDAEGARRWCTAIAHMTTAEAVTNAEGIERTTFDAVCAVRPVDCSELCFWS
jgi:hypothetical protein